MLNNIIEKLYGLSLQQRLLAINLSAFSALVLVLFRYIYLYSHYNNISVLIFAAISISALAITLLLIHFYLVLGNFNPEKFIDNKDWLCAGLVLLGYGGTFLAKYSLGERFQSEALALSFMLILQSAHLNRFSPFIAIPVMSLTSLLYSWGIDVPQLIFVWAFVFMQQITVWGFTLGSLMELRAHAHSQSLTAELKATQELLEHSTQRNERMRVGREIHDSMGHHLAALNINLQVCEQLANDESKQPIRICQDSVDNLYQQLNETVDGLKNVSDFDLEHAITHLIKGTPRLDIHFDCTQQLSLNDEYSNAVLRIIQESITNTLKHSDSSNMCIQLSLNIMADNMAEVSLYIADYGSQSIDINDLKHNNGLRGMQERVAKLNGKIQFNDNVQQGFTINISLPYDTPS